DQVGRDAQRTPCAPLDQPAVRRTEAEVEAIDVLVLAAARPTRLVAMGRYGLDEIVRPAERGVYSDLVGVRDRVEQGLVVESGLQPRQPGPRRAPIDGAGAGVGGLCREVDAERPHRPILKRAAGSPAFAASTGCERPMGDGP